LKAFGMLGLPEVESFMYSIALDAKGIACGFIEPPGDPSVKLQPQKCQDLNTAYSRLRLV